VISPTLYSAPSRAPLLEYASFYWGEHTKRGTTENVRTLALKLLDRSDEHISAQPLLLRYNEDRGSGPYFDRVEGPTGFTGLHGVAYLGIAHLVTAVLEMKEWDVNGADCMSSTALTWAARRGHKRWQRYFWAERVSTLTKQIHSMVKHHSRGWLSAGMRGW